MVERAHTKGRDRRVIPDTASSAASVMVDVAEWRKAMEGVTPGPWRPSRFGFQVVSDYPEPAWQSVVELTTIARSEPDTEREMLTQQAIANWIARCSPAGISTLLDALSAKDRELAEARSLLAKQYGVKIGRAVCLVSTDGERVTDIYDIPAERMPHGYDYAEELESAERDRDEALSALREKEERIGVLEAEVAALPVECSQAATEYLRDHGEYGWANMAEGIRGAISDAIRVRAAITPVSREQRGEA